MVNTIYLVFLPFLLYAFQQRSKTLMPNKKLGCKIINFPKLSFKSNDSPLSSPTEFLLPPSSLRYNISLPFFIKDSPPLLHNKM